MSVEKYIVTRDRCNSFTQLPNNVIQGLNDLEALGLWCNLASRPIDWVFYKEQIRDHFHVGRDKLEKLLKILKSHNLVEINPTRNEKGQYTAFRLHVKDGLDFCVDNSKKYNKINDPIHYTEKPVTGYPVTGFSTATNKEITNKDKKQKKRARSSLAPLSSSVSFSSKKAKATEGLKNSTAVNRLPKQKLSPDFEASKETTEIVFKKLGYSKEEANVILQDFMEYYLDEDNDMRLTERQWQTKCQKWFDAEKRKPGFLKQPKSTVKDYVPQEERPRSRESFAQDVNAMQNIYKILGKTNGIGRPNHDQTEKLGRYSKRN